MYDPLGAKKFLLASYPDLSTLPYRNFITSELIQTLHNYSVSYRQQISQLAMPEHQVAYADFFGLFQKIFEHPKHFGFDPNVLEKSCLTGAYSEAPRTLCDDPDKFVFWDEFHVSVKSTLQWFPFV